MVVRCSLCVFFFFKQKTAYELRISDWSSDVCSSDLQRVRTEIGLPLPDADNQWRSQPRADQQIRLAAAQDSERERPAQLRQHVANRVRSEEHTSELQSLMRISYAVFCLKQKTKQKHKITTMLHIPHTHNTTIHNKDTKN